MYSVAFSPDGKTLAAGSGEGTIQLWDVAHRQPVGTLAADDPGEGQIHGVAFSPDGRTLAAGSDDGTVQLWNIGLQPLVRRACAIANRNMTLQEWRQYLGDVPYEKTCVDVPSPA